MKKLALFFLLLTFLACQKIEEEKLTSDPITVIETKVEPTIVTKTQVVSTTIVDIPKIANKSPKELDAIFGKPKEAKKTAANGEYRLYNLPNEPKGLAVRFLDGRALNFNLILSKSFATSQEALLKGFGINVGGVSATKNVNEPLSEKFQGKFNDVKFEKVSARRDEKGNDFVFVLAEVEQ
jgi:hypothetical protein